MAGKQRNENAVLRIISTQTADGETDRSELNTTAHYRYSPNETEIVYTELDENGNENGETVITVLADNLVTIHKTGFTEAVMILECGKTHAVRYNTMLGTMDMLLCALDVKQDLHSSGGRLQLRYLIDIGEAYSAQNSIDLRVSLRSSR
ncbi:MAG: DUF1934 domain-containing protein [Oscillospiraceae bacterium]|nr:DUF1934 domain-containing protein [Oscillospiraceae bacterium]MCR4760209.1 DUF1934 domain-containing protein [Oscillospiraceae bacterium]